MSALTDLLFTYRKASQTEREKGTYFEELSRTYLRNEPTYKDLYSTVWMYSAWAKEQGIDARDTGIDLVAKTQGTNEYHAIQCKFYAPDYRIQKSDIDSFFTASGKKIFSHRIIITTTNIWSEHADDALRDQHPPVTKIDLHDLENSQIDWAKYQPKHKPVLKEKKKLRDYQTSALLAVQAGLKEADRGKLIMACGTGKTFISLKIAEKLAGKGRRVLFLVPSLSLLSQILTEWTQHSQTPLHSFAVCSDSEVGHKRKKDDDVVETFAHELRYPATTDSKRLADEMEKRHDLHHMSVVFSTYHSIEVIHKAQHKCNLADFDLIICDEAHRTTGVTFENEDESNFVRIHDSKHVRGAKRIYMTATPRIYSDAAKAVAEKENAALYDMNNKDWYGNDLYVLTFSESVRRDLLVDYKVVVLAVDEVHINSRLQKLLADDENQIKVDDAGKIIGCWKALSKQGMQEELIGDSDPMHKAVAFCQVIEFQKGAKKHKVSSKNIAEMFRAVVEAYQDKEPEYEKQLNPLKCEAEHVDGGMNATEKETKLNWLKARTDDNVCRILSNVRCLSEGVDVPALDAVLFLTPRNSQVDVVQSVGRVMRKVEGKKRGYVILPVVIPAGVEAHEALNDNVTYKVVWQVLQALRSHDDRFDAMINKLDLIGQDHSKMEIIAVTDKIVKKTKEPKPPRGAGAGGGNVIGKTTTKPAKQSELELRFEIGEIERAIYATVVKKCGNRMHWEDWANDIAKIANTHIARITAILNDERNKKEIKVFNAFADELRDDLNDSITDEEVVEMLAQHLITNPVFDALFSDYNFVQQNPISCAMSSVLKILQEHRLEKEADTLTKFYESVKMRAEGIDNAQGKQKIIVELYDKFFRNAFPKMTKRLGIVYTPVEVVDFIIHSVNDVLRAEFGQSLGNKGVHIIDPFTGTGTFITRILQSGLINKKQLPHKYKNEIHANEIILLAYYIAAINIEAVYHSFAGDEYQIFEGICLTDTFQLYEKDDLVSEMMVDNSARRVRQKELDIRVIVGNPPYSSGQRYENDNNRNISYSKLDNRIRETYAKYSNATSTKNLMDPYIRAFRWASDRIGDNGVIGFVTNATFLQANTADGMRKCLVEEFSSLYIFNLRGNQRTTGEMSRKEGGKIFGSGSRTPIAISLLVKNKNAKKHGEIFWHDIDDYLSQKDKLKIINNFKSIKGIENKKGWKRIIPNKYYDWNKQRDTNFYKYMPLGDKKNKTKSSIFPIYTQGLLSSRDAWAYNYSKKILSGNMLSTIDFYNSEIDRYRKHCKSLAEDDCPEIDDFVTTDSTKISWSGSLKDGFKRGKLAKFDAKKIMKSYYRPFTKQWLYYDNLFNHRLSKTRTVYPNDSIENKVIYLSGSGASGKDFSVIITDLMPDLNLQHSSGQGFPLYTYENDCDGFNKSRENQDDLFPSKNNSNILRNHGIGEEGLRYFLAAYSDENISKDDIFYYIYGLLHSSDYREKYGDSLAKELPHIPCVKTVKDFWLFSRAGRELSELHINYESAPCYPVTIKHNKMNLTDDEYRVIQMKFANKNDKSTVIYNNNITISDIPIEAYEYVVNSKSALEWVMECQAVITRKDSGIVNDANLWATETMGNAKYPLELFQRVITVSMVTMKIVNSLPTLTIAKK